MKPRHPDDSSAKDAGSSPLWPNKIAEISLVGLLWLTCLAKGGNDLWVVTGAGGLLSFTLLMFLAVSYQHRTAVLFPFLPNLALLMGAALISSCYAYDLSTARLELWILVFSSTAFFLFLNHFKDASARRQFLGYAGIIVLPITLMAVGECLISDPSLLLSHGSFKASFTNSAVLAGFALSWSLIFWHFGRNNTLYRCLFGACLAILVVAQSWWSLICLLIGLMYYYKNHIKVLLMSDKKQILYAASLALFILLLATLAKLRYSAQATTSISDRWTWWVTGFRIVREHPLVGVGLGGFGTAFPYLKPEGMLNTLYAHSFPIQLLSETGLIGVGCALLLGTAYWRELSSQKNIPDEFMAYRATVISILAFSLTSIYLEYFIGKLMLMMAVALTLSSIPGKTRLLSKRAVILITIGVVLMVPRWYLPFIASQYYLEGLRHYQTGDLVISERYFRNSLRLNPNQDESAAALARIFRMTYQRDRRPADFAEWHTLMNQAVRRKRDIRYVMDLSHPPDE